MAIREQVAPEQPMADSYDSSSEYPHPEMDELLCEYVDGTMDPSVRCVFEEYLRSDPNLAAHVERLGRTRRLLCKYGCSMQAPDNFQKRLHAELTTEMMAGLAPLFEQTSDRLRHITMATSVLVVATLFAVLVLPDTGYDPLVAEDITASEQAHAEDVRSHSVAPLLYQASSFAPERPPRASLSFGTSLTSTHTILTGTGLRLTADP
jgi:anti-sigma factor RsiW